MIVFRLALVALGLTVIVGITSGVASILPCPQVTAPPGLTSDFFSTWSAVIFFACLVFVAIPFLSFQLWAAALPVLLGGGFALAFAQTGEWRFALFLGIQCAITIAVSLTFNAVATAMAEVLDWSHWTLKIIALPIAYATANGWGYVQAIGFSQSLC